MNRIKFKVLTLLVVLVLCTTLFSACKITINTGKDAVNTAPASTKTPAESNPKVTEPSSEPSDNIPSGGSSIARWEGSTFVNDWAGFKITLPDGWVKASDQEIIDTNKLDASAIVGSKANGSIGQFSSVNAIYPMFILKYPLGTQNGELNSNITILYEKFSSINVQSVTNASDYSDNMKAQLESYGYACERGNDYSLGGASYSTLIAEYKDYNMQQRYFTRLFDGYLITIIFTGSSNNTAELDAMMNLVQAA